MAEDREILHFLDYWRILRSRKEIVIAIALIVSATGILLTFSMAKEYDASVVLQVKEEMPDVNLFAPGIARPDPYYLRTQAEIIQAGPVLKEVIRTMNLAEEIGKAYGYYDALGEERSFEKTYDLLSRRMKVRQYRDTDLIEVQIRLSEPKNRPNILAAEMANMVGTVFRDQTMRRSLGMAERAMKTVQEQLERAKQDVAAAEKKLEDIRLKYRIITGGGRFGSENSVELLGLSKLMDAKNLVLLEVVRKKQTYEKIRDMTVKDVVEFLRVVGDMTLSGLVAQRRSLSVERESLLSSLGAKHPDVVRLDTSLNDLDAKIEDQFKGLKTGILSDYEVAVAQLRQIETMLEQKRTQEVSSDLSGYLEFDRAQEEVERLKKLRNDLELRFAEKKIEQQIPRTIVHVVKPAAPADIENPVSPNVVLNIILSVLTGLACGIGLAFFVEYLDTSVKTIEDIERYLGVSVLGVIPQRVRPFVDEASDPAHAEAYRVLRTNIQFSKKLQAGKTFCITSGSVGEGKSLTLFNLAYVCAQLGDRVLIVDSDLRRPRQHRIVDVPRHTGLANVLLGEAVLRDAIVATKLSNLDLLPSGKTATEAYALLDTRRMRDLIAEVKESYDFVFFDAPPIIGVSDTSILIREVDGVLLVIQHRKYPRIVSARARDMIQNMGANLIGVVLNNISISRDRSYYYYYQHYYAYPRRKRRSKAEK